MICKNKKRAKPQFSAKSLPYYRLMCWSDLGGGNLASSTARQLKNLCPHPKRKCQYLRWGWSTPIFCSNRGRVINPLVAVYMPIKGIYYEKWERGPIPLFLELIDTGHMWHQLSVEIWLWNFNNRPPPPHPKSEWHLPFCGHGITTSTPFHQQQSIVKHGDSSHVQSSKFGVNISREKASTENHGNLWGNMMQGAMVPKQASKTNISRLLSLPTCR